MLPPLNPRVLDAFVCDGDDHGCDWVESAKISLNESRNLSWGMQALLWTYGGFRAAMYDDRDTMNRDGTGAKVWRIVFRDPPFNHLFIYPTLVEGAIELRINKQPFLSVRIFDQPQNWQWLHRWIWNSGDERQIARSIPQLDPQRVRALVNDRVSIGRDGEIHEESFIESQTENDELSVLVARTALAMGNVGEGIYKMLLAFQIFKPSLQWKKSFEANTEMNSKLWYIIFLVSPFRSLRLQPSTLESLIDIYAFDKLFKSLPITASPQSWQALLECVWNYGNERHIAKAEYKASHPRPGTKARSKGKRQVAEQPLLHRVLRTAGFKSEQQSNPKPRQLENVAAAANTVTTLTRRSPLRSVDSTRRSPLCSVASNGQSRPLEESSIIMAEWKKSDTIRK